MCKSLFPLLSASERGYSPAVSSLNHSYETLNALSEAGEEQTPSNGAAPYAAIGSSVSADDDDGEDASSAATSVAVPRKPSRPAPPVPLKEQFEHSKEVLFGRKHAVIAVAGFGRHDRAWVAGGGSNRCPVTR